MRQRAGALGLAAGSILLFGVLFLLVLTGATDRLDLWVNAWIDPDPAWNPRQETADHAVRAFEPVREVAVATALALLLSAWLRRVRPLLLTLGVVGAASVAELGVKWALPRLQPYEPVHHAGSFPSGHVTVTLACAGALVLAAGAAARWWAWATVAVLGSAMAAGLLITDTHRLTDLVGGALIAVGTLALAACVTPGPDRRGHPQFGGRRTGTSTPGAFWGKDRRRRTTPSPIS